MTTKLINTLSDLELDGFIAIIKGTPRREVTLQSGVIWNLAISKGSSTYIDFLLNMKILPSIGRISKNNLNDLGMNCIYSCIKNENFYALKVLTDKYQVNEKVLSHSLVHLSIKSFAESSDVLLKIATLLLKGGANANYLNRTPMLNASLNSSAFLVSLLVEYGAIMSFTNCVDLYLSVNDVQVTELLLRGHYDEKEFILLALSQSKTQSFFNQGK